MLKTAKTIKHRNLSKNEEKMLPTDQLAVPPGYSTNIIMFYTQNKKQLCWLLFSKFVVQKCANINRIVVAREMAGHLRLIKGLGP